MGHYQRLDDPRVKLQHLVAEYNISATDLCSYITDFFNFAQLREFNAHIESELGLDDLEDDYDDDENEDDDDDEEEDDV